MGRKKLNLVGRTYGSFVVVRKGEGSEWICKCNCGNPTEYSFDSSYLRKARNINCGCKTPKEKPLMDKSVLFDLYVVQKKKILDIAKKLGVHRNTVGKYIKRFNLNRDAYVRSSSDKKNGRRGQEPNALVGRKFGLLEVIGYADPDNAECLCKCNKHCVVPVESLRNREVLSCGCESPVSLSSDPKNENDRDIRLRIIWTGMLDRGVEVFPDWQSPGAFFKWAYGSGYSKGKILTRKDEEEGYSPDNCLWTDFQGESVIRKNIIYIEMDGERKSLLQWVNEFGLDYNTVYAKYKQGYSEEELFI